MYRQCVRKIFTGASGHSRLRVTIPDIVQPRRAAESSVAELTACMIKEYHWNCNISTRSSRGRTWTSRAHVHCIDNTI